MAMHSGLDATDHPELKIAVEDALQKLAATQPENPLQFLADTLMDSKRAAEAAKQ